MGISEATEVESDIDCKTIAAMFEGGISKMHKQSRAQIGDRTLMDAMLPALKVFELCDNSQSVNETLKAVADAATTGAEATKDMTAKLGRAKNLGDRVLGHQDPGATSVALIFQGFYEGL
jgi:dihydroxyacetone kinase-like protein